ncbi:MAG TPA: hypothetical protein VEI02_09435 [Planctomycetota bacterium]|nr:hypothetical protein [Planctomycetota bacterium]
MKKTLSRRMRVLSSCVAVALASAAAPAQLTEWSADSAQFGFPLHIEQTVVAVVDGLEVRCFSALSKSWTSIAVSAPNPQVGLFNEHVIVRDGAVFHAYSARRATVATLATASGVLQTSAPQSWASFVLDGTTLHVFFPLFGTWSTTPLVGAPTLHIGRQAAVFSDAAGAYGVSGPRGSIVPLGVPGAQAAFSEGNAAFALSAGALHGFSGHAGTWATRPLSVATPAFQSGPSYCTFLAAIDGAQVHFFSGHRGTFATAPFPAGAFLKTSRQVGIVEAGATAWAYSGVDGSLTARTFSAAPSTTAYDFFALFETPGELTAFSGPRGAFSSTLIGAFTRVTDQGMAAVTPIGAAAPTHVYSAYQGQWTAAPALAAATVYVAGQCVVLVEPGAGMHALSSRGGGWKFLATPTPDQVWKHTAIVLARAGNALHVFNPRTRAWRTQATVGPAGPTSVKYEIAIAVDAAGAAAYGYSHATDRWTSTPLAGVPLTAACENMVGYLFDSAGLYAYGGTGQLTHTAEFPDFWRVGAQGGLWQLDLAGEPFAPAVVAASLGAAAIPLPPYGTLGLDPASLFLLAVETLDGAGMTHLRFELPIDPSLAGVVLHVQAAVEGAARAYFTNASEATLF